MVKLSNGKVIYAEVSDVLEALKVEITKRGSFDYLRVTKLNDNNIQVCCPYHKDGMEKRPSAGITTTTTQRAETGTFHCFTCSKVSSFSEYVSKCLGIEDDGTVGNNWILTNFMGSTHNPRRKIIDEFLPQEKTKDEIDYVSEKELERYRYIHPYMYERKLTDEVIELFDVGFDRYYQCLTFPVNDIYGNCVFVARRSVKYKMFNYPSSARKPVYALDKIRELIREGTEINTIYVCESIIDALTLWGYGLYAVALLGLGTRLQYDILSNFSVRKYITAFDDDIAGHKATIRFKENVKNKIITTLDITDNKDINDLSYEEFKKLKEID